MAFDPSLSLVMPVDDGEKLLPRPKSVTELVKRGGVLAYGQLLCSCVDMLPSNPLVYSDKNPLLQPKVFEFFEFPTQGFLSGDGLPYLVVDHVMYTGVRCPQALTAKLYAALVLPPSPAMTVLPGRTQFLHWRLLEKTHKLRH